MLTISCLDNDCVMLFNKFWGEHGLSFLVETNDKSILFDVGTSGEIISHNLVILKKDLSKVTHIVVSHGHYDHTGGLEWALANTHHPKVIADPNAFTPKFSRRNNELKETGIRITEEEVRKRADLYLTTEVYKIAEGITVSGRVPRRTNYETTPDTMLIKDDHGEFATDTFIDDLSLFLESEKGLIVLLGCCHAGLINTLDHARKLIPMPIHAVIGGAHMVEANSERIEKTIQALRDEYKPEYLYLNHCSGENAMVAMKNAFGKIVQSCPAGFSKTF